MVAFSKWPNQGTNVKLIEDVLKMSVEVTANNGGIIEGNEIKIYLELVVGDGKRGK